MNAIARKLLLVPSLLVGFTIGLAVNEITSDVFDNQGSNLALAIFALITAVYLMVMTIQFARLASRIIELDKQAVREYAKASV